MSALPSPQPPDAAAAAGTLYERYAGPILGFCLRRLGSREDAEDAMQVTFLNAFRGLSRGTRPEFPSAWLYRIAENACRERAGSREVARDPGTLAAVPDRPAPDVDLLALEEALRSLPARQRRAILLREWRGLSYDEIARELGVGHAAVEALIFRARRNLAGRLSREGKRRARALDGVSALGSLKAVLGGGAAAVKVAAATLALAAGALGAAELVALRAGHETTAGAAPAGAVAAATGAPGAGAPASSGRDLPAPGPAGERRPQPGASSGASGTGDAAAATDVRGGSPPGTSDRPEPGQASPSPASSSPTSATATKVLQQPVETVGGTVEKVLEQPVETVAETVEKVIQQPVETVSETVGTVLPETPSLPALPTAPVLPTAPAPPTVPALPGLTGAAEDTSVEDISTKGLLP